MKTEKLLAVVKNRSPLHPRRQWSVVWAVLNVCAIGFKLGIHLHGLIEWALKLGKSPFLGDIDLMIK